MSRKKRTVPKGNVVWHQTAEEATLAGKPHYNGFACGHGAHGSAKYDRAKAKRSWQAQMRQEGTSRGSFSFALPLLPPFPPSYAIAIVRMRRRGIVPPVNRDRSSRIP